MIHDAVFQKGYFKRLAKVFEEALKPPSKSAGFEPEGTPKSSGYDSAWQKSPNSLDSKSTTGSFATAGSSKEDPGTGGFSGASNGAGSFNGNEVSKNGDAPEEKDDSVANGNGTEAEGETKNGAEPLPLDEQVKKCHEWLCCPLLNNTTALPLVGTF